MTKLNISSKVKDRRLSVTSREVTRSVSSVANKNFSKSEINTLNNSGGIRIVVRKVQQGHLARYNGIVKGKHCFTLDPSAISDEETITHEIVHALQETDKTRPVLDRKLSASRMLSNTELSKKEALTEAETIARVQKANLNATQYYDDINDQCKRGKNKHCATPRTMKKEDRKRLTDNTDRPQGKRSVTKAHKKFPKLNISKYTEE